MFTLLKYQANKEALREYFYNNFDKTQHHKTAGSEIFHWRKLFDIDEIAAPIVEELGLSGMNLMPRLSFQYRNTILGDHIDIDRMIAVNLNLMDEPAVIHLNDVPYSYEAALIDVGTIRHRVESIAKNRLVLKLAIREPWDKVYPSHCAINT